MAKSKNAPWQVAQGDVLIERTTKEFSRAKPVRDPNTGACVLAYGEVTGHSHTVVPSAGATATLYDVDGSRYLDVVGGSATVVHQEHDVQTLPEGSYLVRDQREYDDEGEIRVLD